MSFNKILQKVPVGSIPLHGKNIPVFVATQTSEWTRPQSIAIQQGPQFLRTVEESKTLVPEGTKAVCQREANHSNPEGDNRDHYTGVCFDEEGNGKSVHFPLAKK